MRIKGAGGNHHRILKDLDVFNPGERNKNPHPLCFRMNFVLGCGLYQNKEHILFFILSYGYLPTVNYTSVIDLRHCTFHHSLQFHLNFIHLIYQDIFEFVSKINETEGEL